MQLEAGDAANRACAAFCNCSRLDLACPSKMLPMNDPADGRPRVLIRSMVSRDSTDN